MWASFPTASAAVAATAELRDVNFGLVSLTTANWPLYLAQRQGFFEQNGVRVKEVVTGGPVQAANQLATGAVDIAENGTDSWIRAVAQGLPVKIIAPGFIPNPYTLVSSSAITTWPQLKGKSVILGTRTDVTAIAFARMAADHGLGLNDFDIVTAGSTTARYAALKSGHVDAAVLTQPFDILAIQDGGHELGTARQYIRRWVFTTQGINTKWAAQHRAEVVSYLKALIQGVEFGYARPQEAVRILADRLRIPTAVAQKAYDRDFTEWHAFSKTGQLDLADLQAVIAAVLQQGTLKTPPPISDLYDPSYIQQAGGR
jgi:NitT/TauT family transport system substrate-binding protein